jgi:predicted acyl esterase
MDDGVVLRASVAWPTDLSTGARATGRFPVVVEHTPYVELGRPVVPNTYLTEHGYIYVVVRSRGAGASEGEVQQFGPRDGQDGKAIVDWAAHRLEGSDGRVGLLGCSYPGALALTDAAHVGPNSPVKAAIAACIGLNMQQRQVWMMNGLPSASLLNFPPRAPMLMGRSEAVKRYFQQFSDNILAARDEAYDRNYWNDRIPLRFARQIVDNGVPVLLWSGWGDIVETGAVHAYTALQNAHAGRDVFAAMSATQPVSPRYQLIMGGWDHADGLDAGIYLQWFETWLKGVDTGIQHTRTPMHLFEPGTQRWINVAGYPLVDAYTPWYFGANGTLVSVAPRDAGEAELTWGPPESADGRLAFETPPLAEGATLAGPISASVYASSSNTNLELIARLYDVSPDGAAVQISRGAMLGSQSALDPDKSWADRNGVVIWPWPKLERDEELAPGEVRRFEIALASRQWGILPRHKLRLELTTQSPTSICPETGMPENVTEPCGLTAAQKRTLPGGVYRILHGTRWPSALNLPQLPANAFPTVANAVLPTAWDETNRRLDAGEFSLPIDWGIR